MKQLALPVQLRSSSIFATFFAGPNRTAVDQLRNLRPNPRSGSVWVHGARSVGKTHLLQAVCAQAGSLGFRAGYFPCGDAALVPDALSGCEILEFVCLDDFERVAGDAKWERAAFSLFTGLEENGGRLLLASNVPPAAAGIVLRDLSSRLAAGAILKIQPLSDEDQASALVQRARALGADLAPEAAQYLVRRLPRDMESLCTMLDKLDRESLVAQRRLTLPFVRSFLERETKN